MANPNPEKMRVLDLLESGKINAHEAAQLLGVLGGPRFIKPETRENMEEKWQQFTKDCNKFAKDVGCKVQELYKKSEPTIKKASRAALEKTTEAVDKLACALHESLDKNVAAEEAATHDTTTEDFPTEN
jgi:hypothetical protein